MPALVGFLFSRTGMILGGVSLFALALGITSLRLTHAKHDLASLKAAGAAALAKAQAHAAEVERASEKVSADARDALAQQQGQIVYRTRTLVKEIPTHVTPADDARCTVSAGFVRVFNASAGGLPAVPPGASGSDSAPSGIALSSVLGTTVEDFGTAYGWRAEALTWRDWYTAQAKAHR